jgi:Zn-finger nucleic acid-binding protein
MSERQGVEIDYCPKCRGVWLDRGELDKILERAEDQRAVSPRDFSNQKRVEYRDDRPYPPTKRRKSFLGEILDFD